MSARRFFAADSFWNQPLPRDVGRDERSAAVTAMLARDPREGLWMNLHEWTIPVYEVNAATPRHRIGKRFRNSQKSQQQPVSFFMQHSLPYLNDEHPWGHGPGFGNAVPIPAEAVPDGEDDAHMAMIDWETGWAWDMWGARRNAAGEWEAGTGMTYRIDGPGVFDPADFAVHRGESIHFYGPSRASGVPAIAGLIMRDEVVRGKIEHKLAFATRYCSEMEFVFPPATWTDGCAANGLPQGATLRLNPALDLAALPLSAPARVVAKALQDYGMVCVDFAGGNTLYGEGTHGPADPRWRGLLEQSDLQVLRFENFHLVQMDGLRAGGYDASDRRVHLV